MLNHGAVKPEEGYRCCVCHGGPSDALGKMQFVGTRAMQVLESSNPWAHRLCIPTYLRARAAEYHGEPGSQN